MTYEEQLRDLRAQGLSMKEIALRVGKPERTVSRHMKSFGLTKAPDRTDISDDDILSAWNSGLTIVEIAKKFHCSHDTVTKRLAKYDIKCDRVSGIKRHFKRTHEELWPDIKSDLDAGLCLSAVREKYHVRFEKLLELMEAHEYESDRGRHFATSEWERRMQAAVNHTTGECEQWDAREVQYLNAFRAYYDEFGRLPHFKCFCEFIGESEPKVRAMLRTHGLDMFIDLEASSDAVSSILSELHKFGIKYDLNNRQILPNDGRHVLEIDIYLPDFKLGIEVNPVSTHSPDIAKFGIADTKYHQKKALLAESVGIGLLHVYDEDMQDSRRRAVLMRHIAGLAQSRIVAGARNCDVHEISASESGAFLDDYHFQGREMSSSFRYGLFLNNELVSVLCVGRPRYTTHDFEIVRYCVRPGYAISGGFMKLFKYFIKQTGATGTVVSYMDLNKRFSSENIYEKSGFELETITQPDYLWAKRYGLPILRRYETTKVKLVEQGYDPNKSEIEIMRGRGYFRVFGAGSKRYVYRI